MFSPKKRLPLAARLSGLFVAVFLAALLSNPRAAQACACGCGIFDVGTSALLPSGKGGTLSFEYDFVNQNRNWSGSSSSDAANNDDKQVRTSFYTVGLQYMFNRSWGLQVKLPYWYRNFTVDEGGGPEGYQSDSLGDIRLTGIYTGFSEDMSTGVTFGLKLPTGTHTANGFDRDTQIGTGSTDLLLGAFHRGHIPVAAAGWDWFTRASWQQPLVTVGGYRPGADINGALGVDYDAGPVGIFGKVAPVFQVLASHHLHDSGANAMPANTGYTRLLVAPGMEFALGKATLYTDVEIPVYDHVRGNQLVSAPLFKAVVSYRF